MRSMISDPPDGQPDLAVQGPVELLVHVVALEHRQRLGLGVVVLDPVGQLGADRRHVVAHGDVQLAVVDEDAAVVLAELLADDPHRHVGLAVEQCWAPWTAWPGASICAHCDEQPAHVVLDLLGGDALGRGAHDHAVLGRLHPVEDRPQPLALLVGQSLGDAVGRRVGDQHHEPTGQRHLLGQAGALGPDGVLGDLAEDRLARLEHVLDPGPTGGRAALDVLGVVVDVAAVQHGVLGGADVDERRLHARQHVLHPAQVDVAVDLRHVVGGVRHVVLDQRPALEHGDLRGPGRDVDAHRVAADRRGPCARVPAGARGSPRRARRARGRSPPRRVCPGLRWLPPRAAERAPRDRPAGAAAACLPRLAIARPSPWPAPRSGAARRRGCVSPILGLAGAPGGAALRTTALAAASTDAGRPSRWRSGSSGKRSSSPSPGAAGSAAAAGSARCPRAGRACGCWNGWRERLSPAGSAGVWPSVRGLLRLRPPREPRRRRLRGVSAVGAAAVGNGAVAGARAGSRRGCRRRRRRRAGGSPRRRGRGGQLRRLRCRFWRLRAAGHVCLGHGFESLLMTHAPRRAEAASLPAGGR